MKRILLLSLIVLAAMVLLPSCTRTVTIVVTPTPTVDHGRYTPMEAVAMVREFLFARATCINATAYVSRLSLSARYNGSGEWFVGDFLLYENSGAVVPNGTAGTRILYAIDNLNKQGQ